MTSILRYAARVPRKTSQPKLSVAIVGAGSLASFLAPALARAGFKITEIITRGAGPSQARARVLASKVGARATTMADAALNAQLIWFCVPDREIGKVAATAAKRLTSAASGGRAIAQRFAFHSSGALCGSELKPLRTAGFAVASVHPLMTFVKGARPSLERVPFALEGDVAATKLARRIVADLKGESFLLPARRKAAYHAWATMTSPLLLAYLVTLENAARSAGLRREDARRMSLPIIRQTLDNYRILGPRRSFSGPFIRGDATTVARHLALLKGNPNIRAVYRALGWTALSGLPVRNKSELRRLLEN